MTGRSALLLTACASFALALSAAPAQVREPISILDDTIIVNVSKPADLSSKRPVNSGDLFRIEGTPGKPGDRFQLVHVSSDNRPFVHVFDATTVAITHESGRVSMLLFMFVDDADPSKQPVTKMMEIVDLGLDQSACRDKLSDSAFDDNDQETACNATKPVYWRIDTIAKPDPAAPGSPKAPTMDPDDGQGTGSGSGF